MNSEVYLFTTFNPKTMFGFESFKPKPAKQEQSPTMSEEEELVEQEEALEETYSEVSREAYEQFDTTKQEIKEGIASAKDSGDFLRIAEDLKNVEQQQQEMLEKARGEAIAEDNLRTAYEEAVAEDGLRQAYDEAVLENQSFETKETEEKIRAEVEKIDEEIASIRESFLSDDISAQEMMSLASKMQELENKQKALLSGEVVPEVPIEALEELDEEKEKNSQRIDEIDSEIMSTHNALFSANMDNPNSEESLALTDKFIALREEQGRLLIRREGGMEETVETTAVETQGEAITDEEREQILQRISKINNSLSAMRGNLVRIGVSNDFIRDATRNIMVLEKEKTGLLGKIENRGVAKLVYEEAPTEVAARTLAEEMTEAPVEVLTEIGVEEAMEKELTPEEVQANQLRGTMHYFKDGMLGSVFIVSYNNPILMLEAIKKNPKNLKRISKSLAQNPEFIEKAKAFGIENEFLIEDGVIKDLFDKKELKFAEIDEDMPFPTLERIKEGKIESVVRNLAEGSSSLEEMGVDKDEAMSAVKEGFLRYFWVSSQKWNHDPFSSPEKIEEIVASIGGDMEEIINDPVVRSRIVDITLPRFSGRYMEDNLDYAKDIDSDIKYLEDTFDISSDEWARAISIGGEKVRDYLIKSRRVHSYREEY